MDGRLQKVKVKTTLMVTEVIPMMDSHPLTFFRHLYDCYLVPVPSLSHSHWLQLRSKGTQSPEPLIIRTKGSARPTATMPWLSFVADGDEVNVHYHGESTMMAPHDRPSSPACSPSASPSLSSHSAQLTAPSTAPSHTEVGRESQRSNDVTVTLAALPPSLPRVGSDPPTSSVEHLTDNPSVPAATPLPPSQITGSKGDKLSHYEGWTKTVLRKAMRGYEGRLGAINMCPEEATQSSWAQEEWRIQFESDEQPIKLSDEMLKLVFHTFLFKYFCWRFF